MTIILQQGVTPPPAGMIERFAPQIRAVALTWLAMGKLGFAVQITSWWRDEARNAAAGGKRYSQHLVGTAMDGLVPGYSRAQLLPFVARVARYYGAVAPPEASEGSGRSVHVQGLPVGTVKTLLTREPMLVRAAQDFVGPPRPVGV